MATIVGTDNQDNLNGTESADEFFGRKGADNLFGLGGNDTFYWDAGKGITAPGSATIGDSDGSDIIDGGSGTDRFVALSDYHYSMTGSPSVGFPTFSLTRGVDGFAHFREMQGYSGGTSGTAVSDVTLNSVEQFSFDGTKNTAPINSGGAVFTTSDFITVGDLTGTSLAGAQLVFDLGSSGDSNGAGSGNFLDASAATNSIVTVGGNGNDTMIGGSMNDQMIGNAGNDTFRGNGGTNTMIGGTGNDVYYSDNRNDTIIEHAGEGSDLIRTIAIFYSNRANVEALIFDGAGNFTGVGTSGNEAITGGEGNDYLIGLGGNDTLDGQGGANTLQGGTGDDAYYTGNPNDSIIEFAGEGTDTVVTQLATYTLRADVENLTFLGSGTRIGYGNNSDNALFGGEGSNTLYGYGGNDTLIALGVNNTLFGGAGDDVYIIASTSDQIVEYLGEGRDAVFVNALSYTLTANIENLYNSGAGTISLAGNALDNLINGGSGSDTLSGLAGNDTLIGGSGIDTASYISASAGVVVSLNGGSASNDGFGGRDALSQIENIIGSTFDDIIAGDAGDNRLDGSLGRDVIVGRAGKDVLIGGDGAANQLQGGLGNDIYYASAVGDTLVEFANEGIDAVFTTLSSFTLRANVENLTFTGTGSFTGIGNASDNFIAGGAAADVLSGEAGSDTLVGGGSGDDLAGGTGPDRFVFDTSVGGGEDLVRDFSHSESDKIDVSQLLNEVGYQGSDPFADGYLRSEAIAAYGNSGPAQRLYFDADGTGPQGEVSLAVFLGGTAVFAAGDFIYGP